MGTGKTSVGKLLAKKTKRQFVDLDELIQLREKRLIADIFAKDGEAYFRRLEKQTLKEVAKEKKFVVACGGGIVTDPENIRLMKSTGIMICLTASLDTILKRTLKYAHRPLLNVANPKKQIELLLKFRAPYYTQADKILDTSGVSIKEVVDAILKIISPKAKKRQRKNKTNS
jgi:shikimate kinase